MWRISKRQQEGNIYLQELDSYLYADIAEVKNDKIVFTAQMQKLFIKENFTSFSDITASIKDLLKLEEIAVVVIDSLTKEEKEVMIEIEGGI
jgi:hypothetical protein